MSDERVRTPALGIPVIVGGNGDGNKTGRIPVEEPQHRPRKRGVSSTFNLVIGICIGIFTLVGGAIGAYAHFASQSEVDAIDGRQRVLEKSEAVQDVTLKYLKQEVDGLARKNNVQVFDVPPPDPDPDAGP